MKAEMPADMESERTPSPSLYCISFRGGIMAGEKKEIVISKDRNHTTDPGD